MRFYLITALALLCGSASAEDIAGMKNIDGFWVAKSPEGYARITKVDSIDMGRWEVDCAIDKMSDKRKCFIFAADGAPALVYDEERLPKQVCVKGHNFPGRKAMIRVDANPPVSTDPAGCLPADQLMPQLSAGKTMIARWLQFPYDQPIDTETSLAGLSIAMKVVAEYQDGKVE